MLLHLLFQIELWIFNPRMNWFRSILRILCSISPQFCIRQILILFLTFCINCLHLIWLNHWILGFGYNIWGDEGSTNIWISYLMLNILRLGHFILWHKLLPLCNLFDLNILHFLINYRSKSIHSFVLWHFWLFIREFLANNRLFIFDCIFLGVIFLTLFIISIAFLILFAMFFLYLLLIIVVFILIFCTFKYRGRIASCSRAVLSLKVAGSYSFVWAKKGYVGVLEAGCGSEGARWAQGRSICGGYTRAASFWLKWP